MKGGFDNAAGGGWVSIKYSGCGWNLSIFYRSGWVLINSIFGLSLFLTYVSGVLLFMVTND